MKKILILLFLPLVLLSQNFDADTLHFRFGTMPTTPRPLSPSLPEFTADRFLIGWHWSGLKYVDETMKLNFRVGGFSSHYNHELADSSFLVIASTQPIYANDQSREDNAAMQTRSFQYEPTLQINPNLPINNLPNDPTNSVFGFQNIIGRYENHRLVLEQSAITTPELVLSNNWIANRMEHTGLYDGHDFILSNTNPPVVLDTGQVFALKSEVNGTHWYLSLNLRKYLESDTNSSSSTALKIKVKYVIRNSAKTTGYIVFDSLPSADLSGVYDIIDSRGRNRGKALNMIESASDEFIITPAMLPWGSDRDITISAHFKCFQIDPGNDPITNNRFLKGRGGRTNVFDSLTIDSLLIEVSYEGGSDVAIDWLRFETKKARRLFRGEFDEGIRNEAQRILDSLSDDYYVSRAIKLYRFFGRDEWDIYHMHGMRYLNILLGGLTYTTKAHEHELIQDYHVNIDNIMVGGLFLDFKTPAPYIRFPNFHDWNPQSMNYRYGSYGYPYEVNDTAPFYTTCNMIMHPRKYKDTLISRYETGLAVDSHSSYNSPNFSYLKGLPTANYMHELSRLYSLQSNIEHTQMLMIGINPNEDLFQDRNCLAYLFVGTNTDIKKSCDSVEYSVTTLRSKTYEELRYAFGNTIILGAKGFSMDRASHKSDDLFLGLVDGISSSGVHPDSLVDTEYFGGDFLSVNDFSDVGRRINYDSVIVRHGIADASRVYIGRRSGRLALNDVVDYVRANEQELMKLKLQAWYGKGFRDWYKEHPQYSNDTILSRYLDFKNIRTSKLWQPHYTGAHNFNKVPEAYDSSFFDITLHRHVDFGMDSVFYIGVQNRRTDPLIFNTDHDSLKEIQFYSGAEFNQYVREGGTDLYGTYRDTTWWQQQWWRRLGAREIELPFNYINPNDTNSYHLLRISELNGEFQSPATPPWYKQAPYYHKISEVIGQDKNIKIRLLPGESRMLKVEVLKPGKLAGNLDHNGQVKIVAHPVYEGAALSDSLIQYHAVYHKKRVPCNGDSMSVYYNRSLPLSKNTSVSNIRWMQEILVSDKINKSEYGTGDTLVYGDCSHPSIIVSTSGNDSIFAHIVYGCDDPVPTHNYNGAIVHAVYNVSSSGNPNPTRSYNNYIDQGKFDRNKGIGSPVINASYSGKYVAWTDSLRGVRYCFIPNGQSYPDSIRTISHLPAAFIGCNPPPPPSVPPPSFPPPPPPPTPILNAAFPTVNAYSRIDNEEDDCGLAWNMYCELGNRQMFYTRLFHDSNNVAYHNLSKNILGPHFPYIYDDTTIVRFTGAHDHSNGSLYRFLQNSSVTNEFIVFQENSRFADNDSKGLIIQNFRQYGLPDVGSNSFQLRQKHFIFSRGSSNAFTNPNIAQNATLGTQNNSTIGIIDFTFENDETEKTIYNIPIYFNSFLIDSNLTNPFFNRIEHGDYSHLSRYKERNFNPNIWKNRRIYISNDEEDMSCNPLINSSARLFYKNYNSDVVAEAYIGYSSSTYSSQITQFLIDGNPIGVKLPLSSQIEDDEEFYEFNGSNTISSESFVVSDDALLSFKMKGHNSALGSNLLIENLNTASIISLPSTSFTSDSSIVQVEYILDNGLGHNYKIHLVNFDTLASYAEDISFDYANTLDTFRLKTPRHISIIDLNPNISVNKNKITLHLYPNPSNDKVSVMALLPTNVDYSFYRTKDKIIELSLYNFAGFLLETFSVMSGNTITIPIQELPTGSYFIKATSQNDLLETTSTSFVISR